MRATIYANGILVIVADNGVESYALDKWIKDRGENPELKNLEIHGLPKDQPEK